MAFTIQQLKDMFDAATAANNALGEAVSQLSNVADYIDTDGDVAEWQGRANAIDDIAWRLFDLSQSIAGLADRRDWVEDLHGKMGDQDWRYVLDHLPEGIEVEAQLLSDEG